MKKTLGTLILFLSSTLAFADTVYQSIDKNGNITFSTSPTANSTPLEIKGSPTNANKPSPQTLTPPEDAMATETLANLRKQLNEASDNYDTAKTVYADSKARADKATADAQKVLNAPDSQRFDQGEAVYLSNLALVAKQQADQAFQNMQQAAAELDNARAALVKNLRQ